MDVVKYFGLVFLRGTRGGVKDVRFIISRASIDFGLT